MKKRFFSLVLVLILCLSFSGTAFAATTRDITPMSAVSLSSGLTHISGATYKPWASATPLLSEDVSVGFRLYRLVDGSYTFVTSGSATGNGYVIAQKTITLSSGSYKLYAWYTGETQSGSSNKYYTI